jgi:conjugative relaxase-like TrwC/TraI family protein
MLTISKPLSSGQARLYHAEEFRNARENYYSQGEEIRGTWHGRLAHEWGLTGEVEETAFARLAEGRHPVTDQALVRHQEAHLSTNDRGETITTMGHRAGWDATFSAPKSVSLTALVGGDDRVLQAHQQSVKIALDEVESYVQARLGGNHPAETTGKWVAASFEHDSARPVEGYAAPQLHTHTVFFNLTETHDGAIRPVQPRELYQAQALGTAIYRAELASQLQDLGYEIDRGRSGQPEIRGYSDEYLAASSPRRQQIEQHLAERGLDSAAAAEIAAHQTREPKLDLSHDDMQARHQEIAERYGQQPEHVIAAAQERLAHAQEQEHEQFARITPAGAVAYAVERNLEREAVVDERVLLRDALSRGMGDVTLREARDAIEARLDTGELVRVGHTQDRPGYAVTSAEMLELEQQTLARMHVGQGRAEALGPADTAERLTRDHARLSESQRAAVVQVLASHDQTLGLDGVAGAGKTTTLAAVRDLAQTNGYEVSGLAPTSRATRLLEEAGIPSVTLQRFVAQGVETSDGQKHLYVLDESTLASTRQMHALLTRLEPDDRLLLVGDVRQHHAVEAGRPFEQLQAAAMETAHLREIVRQTDPALRAVVQQLSRGEVQEAMHGLDHQGRIHEITHREERFAAIARDYVSHAEATLVVSPDNQSRQEINVLIHRERQAIGQVQAHDESVRVLTPRQDLTGADRQWAARYEPGDVLRYTVGSKAHELAPGAYARVTEVDADHNRLTIAREHGQTVTYDPRRLLGVTVYREADRALAVGDRVQITAPDRERRIANRELGTIEEIAEGQQDLRVRLDSGRALTFERDQAVHLDYGYAVTSHSSQGQTAERVLVHVDAEHASEALVNRQFAYVALSRGRSDIQVYTNDRSQLPGALGREHAHASALELSVGPGLPGPGSPATPARKQTLEHGLGHSL